MNIRLLLVILFVLSASNVMALEVTMSAAVGGEAQLMVNGSTNLPDGTELHVTLSDSLYSDCRVESKVIVNGGKFTAGPFPRMFKRECNLDIISQIAAYQPARVRSIIGERGTNLAGVYVVKGSFGGLIVSYADSMTLGKNGSPRRSWLAHPAAQKKPTPFNRYSSYCVLKASGRRDLPPMTGTLTCR